MAGRAPTRPAIRVPAVVVSWSTLTIPSPLLQEVALAGYPREITERFHGTPEQLEAGLVGEVPARWELIYQGT